MPDKLLPLILRSREDLTKLYDILEAAPQFAYDFETSALDIRSPEFKIVGLSFAYDVEGEVQGTYIPFAHEWSELDLAYMVEVKVEWERLKDSPQLPGFGKNEKKMKEYALANARFNKFKYLLKEPENAEFPIEDFAELFQPIFADPEKLAIAWNQKFDESILEAPPLWFEVKNEIWDCQIADWLEYPGGTPSGRGHSLDTASWRYLKKKKVSYKELVSKGRTIASVEIKKAAHYGVDDSICTYRHWLRQVPIIEEVKLTKVAKELCMPIVRVVKNMERTGVRLDVEYMHELREDLQKGADALKEEMNELAGEEVNMNPSGSLQKALFETLGAPTKDVPTNTKGYSTAADVLNGLYKRGFEPASIVMRWREKAKLLSTYIKPLIIRAERNPEHRIYAHFLQTGTTTGRWSSNDPNLQNIPVRTEDGNKIRKAFIATEGWTWLRADFSQSQLRLAAHLANDPTMIQVFQDGGDIHQETIDAVSGMVGYTIERGPAKIINFSMIFGKWWGNLAADLGVEEHVGKMFYDAFFAKYDRIQPDIEATKDFIMLRGYVMTLLRRRRYFADLQKPNLSYGYKQGILRAGVNTRVQGSDSELMLVSQRNIQRQQDAGCGDKIRQLIQVHDEINLEVRNDFIEEGTAMVKAEMENCVKLRVPIVVEPTLGPNWSECKD